MRPFIAFLFNLVIHYGESFVFCRLGVTSNSLTSLSRTALSSSSDENNIGLDRRHFVTSSAALLGLVQKASARGLVQFPVDLPLLNEYHFMRAGTSLLEEQGIWSTNPLFLTNRDDALSEAGQAQVAIAAEQLAKERPTIVKYSLAASCMDTTNVLASQLQIGRDRLVPEFTFLDPRAIGQWDNMALATTQSAVWAMDNDEAGTSGTGARPPANQDGTPHETLADQSVRLRQVLSILETQYGGDTILLVFPDGTGPALLSCMIAGIPLNRVHELEFAPGEIRLDVTKERVLAMWNKEKRISEDSYQKILMAGRENLKSLQSQTDIVSLKDQRIEEEQQVVEQAYREKEAKRLAAEEAKETQRRQMAERAREEQKMRVREKQVAASTQGGGQGTTDPALAAIGFLAVGGTGVLLSGGNGKEEVESLSGVSTAVRVPGNETGSAGFAMANMTAPVDFGTRQSSGATDLSISDSIETIRVNGDSNGKISSTPEDRIQAAEKAMDEYLNLDDGGDAWLNSLAEIASDEEDDEDRRVEDEKK